MLFVDLLKTIFLPLLWIYVVDATNIITLKTDAIQPENPNEQQFVLSHVKGELNEKTFSLFKRLTGLTIEWCAIHDLYPEAFKRTSLEILEIHNNIEFPTISESTFKYLNNLKVLRFNFNPYTEIEDGAFSNLKKLDVLSVSHQNLGNLTKEFLEGLENLKEIALTNNEIKYINKDAFKHMKHLTAVYLGHNNLKNIEFGTFRHQKSLVDLQLQSNKLGNKENSYVVNWMKFDRILNLRYLNIGDNNLSYLDVQQLLSVFPLLESINFMPNNFTCPNELHINKKLRHYNINIEYYGNGSNCKGLDFGKIGVVVFSEP
ncbi:hypothetical protein HHI36_021568 [Cryptolaemus montrouzieri]|uniref:Uncharacterized protein n=1 Tax=Cryptolaemus montrouzieri TaxID=559131 RepID=A0ABD2MYI0_9CUCU